MDLNEQMKLNNEQTIFTSDQKSSIYKKYLIPLKVRISNILLYDSEAASVFLQKYNEITKKEEMTTIMTDITELENEINEYEKSDNGKEKLSEEQSITINNQLECLLGKCEELDIKDFEGEFSDIKEMYIKNSENYSYSDKDSIEQKIASVLAKLIMIKTRENILDLHSEISEDDVPRLAMVINHAIYTLLQSKNPNIQDIVNEIKYKMINRQDAVYDIEIWRLLDSAQRSGEIIEQRDNKPKIEQRKAEPQQLEESYPNTLLPAIPKQRRDFKFPSLGRLFQRKTLKIGNQRMTLADTVQIGYMTPVKVKDLANIDMEWLAQRIPKEMLNDIENEKLMKENNENLKERYIPDRKTPIYRFFAGVPKMEEYEFHFYNEEGSELVCMYEKCIDYTNIWICTKTSSSSTMTKIDVSEDSGKKFKIVKRYVNFIDRITGTNLSQQFYNEIGTFYEKIMVEEKNKTLQTQEGDIIDKLPILKNLLKSYNKLREYVNKTQFNFESQENVKRKKFYENNQFKNDLKVDDNGTMEVSTSHEESEKINENKKDNNHETNGTSDRGGE